MYLSRRICNKQKRTKVISDNLSSGSYYASKRGLPKSERRKAIRYRPMKIRQGNGASVVVRARESLVHGEGKQLDNLIQIMENV